MYMTPAENPETSIKSERVSINHPGTAQVVFHTVIKDIKEIEFPVSLPYDHESYTVDQILEAAREELIAKLGDLIRELEKRQPDH